MITAVHLVWFLCRVLMNVHSAVQIYSRGFTVSAALNVSRAVDAHTVNKRLTHISLFNIYTVSLQHTLLLCVCVCVGRLLQDGVCVQLWQCDCLDSLGQSWAAGSIHQVDCNNCSCTDGSLTCTNHTCAGESACTWSTWSNWASCSSTCGPGRRTRFRCDSQLPSGSTLSHLFL